MLALGLTLVVSVAAAPPPAAAHEQLASTYDQAACDPSDGGECAEEALMDFMPPPAAILDCESPLIAQMIGSCDLPAPTLPTVHLPTWRNDGRGGISTATADNAHHLHVVATASSLDGAMPISSVSLHPAPLAAQLSAQHGTAVKDVPAPRLDRPPRV